MDILKQKCALILALVLMLGINMSAQNIKFERANFPDQENDLKNALSAIASGEEFLFEAEAMLSGDGIDIRQEAKAKDMIYQGLQYFLRANVFNSQSAQLNYTIGKSYYYIGNYTKSLEFLRTAAKLDEQGFKDIDFFLGNVYQILGRIDEAIDSYNAALKNAANTEFGNLIASKIKECKYGQTLMNDAVDVRVENLGTSINALASDYLPIVTNGDEILFFQRFFAGQNRLYASEHTSKGWAPAEETNQILPLTGKKDLAEFTLVDSHKNPILTRVFSLNFGNGSEEPFYEALAALSPDQSTAIFSSNRLDGAGGFDLFMAHRNKKGQWEQPRNLTEINTAGNEFGVVLHPNGKILYFSSNGHQTMGGYDIFKSEFNGKQWSKPENVGYPINSPTDDIVYSISSDGNRLYFSSSRVSGKGGHDIYLVNFMPDVKPSFATAQRSINTSSEAVGVISATPASSVVEPTAVTPQKALITPKYPAALHGFVSDNQSYLPLSVTLRLLDNGNNTEEIIETDSKGGFDAVLSAGGSYRISIDIPGYQQYSEDITVSEELGQKIAKSINLTPLTETSNTNRETLSPVAEEQANNRTEEENVEDDDDDVVILSPLIAVSEVVERAEYPVSIAGLVSDNNTFAPIADVTLKVSLKGSEEETFFHSDEKGLFSFNLASGNTYTIQISAKDYKSYTEEIVLFAKPDQSIVKTIQLQSTLPVVAAPELVAYEHLPESAPDPEPIVIAPIDTWEEDSSAEEPVLVNTIVELTPVPVLVEEGPEPAPVAPVIPPVIVANAVVPEVETPTVIEPEPVVVLVPEPESEPVIVAEEPEPVVVLLPEPEPVVEPIPVVVAEVPAPVDAVVEPEPVVVLLPEPEPVIEPVPVVVAEVPDPDYEEDVVVLPPVLALESNDKAAHREYPVSLQLYVSDVQTLQPLNAAVQIVAKNTEIDETLHTDTKGLLNTTIASGNTYLVTISVADYNVVEEVIELENVPGQSLARSIQLKSLLSPATPAQVVAEVPATHQHAEVEEQPAEPAVETQPIEVEQVVAENVPAAQEQPVAKVQPEPAKTVTEKAKETPKPKVATTPAEKPAAPKHIVAETPQTKPSPLVLTGSLLKEGTKEPVTKATITFTDITRGIDETIQSDNKGQFKANAISGSNYSVKVAANGYYVYVKDLATSLNDKKIELPVRLSPATGTHVATIYFDFDRAALTEQSEQSLRETISALGETQEIQLIGYADNLGGQGYNARLSERRAETVNTYLSVHGIDHGRIQTSWKGLSNPVETNYTAEGRKLNNRVEVWVK